MPFSLMTRMQLKKGANAISALCLILLQFCYVTNGLRRLQGKSQLSSSQSPQISHQSWSPPTSSPSPTSALHLRGGYLHYYQNQPVELNPDYMDYAAPLPPSSAMEHEKWLLEQRRQSEFMTGTPAFRRFENNETLFTRVIRFTKRIHRTSPTIFWTALSCFGIFLLWQIPSMRPILLKLCVCNRSSVVQAAGLPLILGALSHSSLYHLFANMVTLLGIAPGVATDITKPLWPLFLGSALFSNAVWVAFRRSGSCLGLSGVTMSVIAVQARAIPERVYRIFLAGVIPISLPASQILQVLLAVSLVGSFVKNSRIAHLTHLGGLIFGVIYYELFINKRQRKTRSGVSSSSGRSQAWS